MVDYDYREKITLCFVSALVKETKKNVLNKSIFCTFKSLTTHVSIYFYYSLSKRKIFLLYLFS